MAAVVLAATGLVVDGRSFGGSLAHRIVCAVKASCAHDDGDVALLRAYGSSDAKLVRDYLPSLVFEPGERQVPVDWRKCREVRCATVPDDRDLDAHRTDAGHRATVFTRLVRKDGRRYIQYWMYYPDSNTAFAGSDRLWKRSSLAQLGGWLLRGTTTYPGYHRDDWEGVGIRLGGHGAAAIRVTSHGHWQWCKQSRCRGQWGAQTGWTRVSSGSHAGHVPFDALPGHELRERTATAAAIRLVPLERIDRRRYRRLAPDISPPWLKDAYVNPESPDS